ncbi:hypothetical protein HK104_000189 [Borealophlyctis nickersoniae]|nr:hypothetical protein HK104_000189 [Borealophlyctis nickersoniae]
MRVSELQYASPGANVFNNERGFRNYATKGPDNLAKFNKTVVKVRRVNPHVRPNRITNFLKRNKMGIAGSVIAIALDAAHITLAVQADGNQWGHRTTIAVSEVAGGWTGGLVGAKLGAAMGSVFPGVGTAVGAILGGIIGGIAGGMGGGGIASLFISVPYTPTLQATTLVPFHGLPEVFREGAMVFCADSIFDLEGCLEFDIEMSIFLPDDILKRATSLPQMTFLPERNE